MGRPKSWSFGVDEECMIMKMNAPFIGLVILYLHFTEDLDVVIRFCLPIDIADWSSLSILNI